ncbi:MAG TPA: GTP 3',8-cyclase MoaA [Thermoanaerobaculia bacterium]|nr:GTP 3',8-cyclase MoaA [Thermoanaerobaculia bacterium]
MSAPHDRLGRPLTDLRVSVTDRCSLRCAFCMPADRDYEFLPRAELLTYEEMTRLVRLFIGLGVTKVRLTGGEPLLRRDLPRLVSMLAALPGIDDLALTTNGVLLTRDAAALRAAGLARVTVSLHSLREETFDRLSGSRGQLPAVLAGIEAAAAAGLTPVKVNAVVVRGVNDGEVVELARHFNRPGFVLRFIEYMDVGTVNGWQPTGVVAADEILARVGAALPLAPAPRRSPHDVALRYRYLEGGGELGVIASVSQPFCGDCSRARLTADGSLFTCLFGVAGHDLKAPLRGGASDGELQARIAAIWRERADRYSEERAVRLGAGAPEPPSRVEMFRIGG